MTVAFAPVATRLTFLPTAMLPANVPAAILIVSPSWAASSAAWIVAKHQAFLGRG
jgi:hypothetical protein